MPVIYLASSLQNTSSVTRTPAYGELLGILRDSARPAPPSPAVLDGDPKPLQIAQENQKPQQIVRAAQNPPTTPQEKQNSDNPIPGEARQAAGNQNAELLKLEAQIEQLKAQEDALLRNFTPQHPAVRALEAQMQALQTQMKSNDALLDLPDNEQDLLAYLRALAQTRQVSPTPAPPLADLINRAHESSTVPFNFTLNGSAEGTYSIKASIFSGNQECGKSASCQFLIFSNGIVASNSAKPAGYPGMIVNQVLRSGTLEFTLTCNSQECTVVSVEDGKTTSQTLKSNETAVFPESAQISVAVN